MKKIKQRKENAVELIKYILDFIYFNIKGI